MNKIENFTVSEIDNYMKSEMKKTNSNNWQDHVNKLHRTSNIVIVDYVDLIK